MMTDTRFAMTNRTFTETDDDQVRFLNLFFNLTSVRKTEVSAVRSQSILNLSAMEGQIDVGIDPQTRPEHHGWQRNRNHRSGSTRRAGTSRHPRSPQRYRPPQRGFRADPAGKPQRQLSARRGIAGIGGVAGAGRFIQPLKGVGYRV